MIIDKITNLDKYMDLKEIKDDILRFIEKSEKEQLPDGRYEIRGEDLFALVQSYQTRDLSEGRLESHVLYTDLQYIAKGEEVIYWHNIDELEVEEDKRPAADAIFYHVRQPKNGCVLKNGMFGYYMPADGHMPCMRVDISVDVKKIVFKIKNK